MKRTIYALCTAICALFAVVSCSKSDDSNEKKGGIRNNNFPQAVTEVVSQDLIQKMADGGATIYGELIHTSLGNNDPLKNFDGFYYRFYGQNGSKLKIDYENHVVATYAAQGVDAAISGEGDKFTIFFIDKAGDLVALSGEFTGDAIKDFQLTSLVKVADNNSPEGTVRVFKSKKGYAETVRR